MGNKQFVTFYCMEDGSPALIRPEAVEAVAEHKGGFTLSLTRDIAWVYAKSLKEVESVLERRYPASKKPEDV